MSISASPASVVSRPESHRTTELRLPTGTAQRTVYKLVCKRDGCVKSFTGRQSKYEASPLS